MHQLVLKPQEQSFSNDLRTNKLAPVSANAKNNYLNEESVNGTKRASFPSNFVAGNRAISTVYPIK
jgi:hypothetical protein